jgi:poly(A) polymerase/tRNA nucleotidyltransferase (CCA-adding enzyme)
MMNVTVPLPEWPLKPVRAIAANRGVQLWPVGGVVRDALLDRPLHDWDFAVQGDALGLARAVADALGGAYFPLDRERETARVVLRREGEPDLDLDFASLRGPDLQADLRARDFTINGMATGPDLQLIDPLGGLADLQARRVRAVGPESFDDDPLRMLRAVRMVAVIGLRMEATTASWILERAHTLPQVSPERIRDEFLRILAAPAVAEHVHILSELGLLPRIIPEMAALDGQEQTAPHRFDVWWHTLLVIEGVEGIRNLVRGEQTPFNYMDAPPHAWSDVAAMLGRFAPRIRTHLEERRDGEALFQLAAVSHDVGKPLTASRDAEGAIHFYGHESAGARLMIERMEHLRFSRSSIQYIEAIIRAHLRPAHLARVEGPVTRRAVYRFFQDAGSAGIEVVLLSLADHLSTWGPNLVPERWARRLEVAELLLSYYFEQYEEVVDPEPLVDGRDLMDELGLEEGPQIGRLLRQIREAQAAGTVTSRDEALALARSVL